MEEVKQETKSQERTSQVPGHPAGCQCRWCRWGVGHRWGIGFFLFRILLLFVIVLIVFWLGVKVGEFKTGSLRHFRGYYGTGPGTMMRGRGFGSYGQMPYRINTAPASS